MMHVGIPKPKPVIKQILDRIYEFEGATGIRPRTVCLSHNLMSTLFAEEYLIASKPYYEMLPRGGRRIFGLPLYCIEESDIILVGL